MRLKRYREVKSLSQVTQPVVSQIPKSRFREKNYLFYVFMSFLPKMRVHGRWSQLFLEDTLNTRFLWYFYYIHRKNFPLLTWISPLYTFHVPAPEVLDTTGEVHLVLRMAVFTKPWPLQSTGLSTASHPLCFSSKLFVLLFTLLSPTSLCSSSPCPNPLTWTFSR